ncbi:MAG TPA: hypothetical protein VF736_00085 [Pyrinomonadaceae bacterium]|jgi:hypothetical protein
MSSLSFQPVQGGLYRAAGAAAGQKVLVYWLLLTGAPPAGDIKAADTWNTYSGCHVFVPADKPIQDPAGFAAALAQLCTPPQADARWVAWVTDPAGVPGTASAVNANVGAGRQAQTIPQFSLALANFALAIPQKTVLTFEPNPTLSPGTPSLQFANGGGGAIALQRGSAGINLSPDNGVMIVPLAGASAGAVLFEASWDRGEFYTFFVDDQSSWDTPGGAETRFFYGPKGGERTLRYPVFQPEQTGAGPLALDVSLDPLNVWDGGRTLFALDVERADSQGIALPTSEYFRTTDGHVLHLVPRQGAGYALGARPQGPSSDGTDSYCYLTPVGLFDANPPAKVKAAGKGKAAAKAGAAPNVIQHAMCGLTGTEYLLVAPGATVEFVTGNSAYSAGFTPPSGDGLAAAPQSDPCNPGDGGQPVVPGRLLTPDFTTSWVRVNPAPSPPGGIDYGYAVQPEAAVYYSTVLKPAKSGKGGAAYPYPLALGCRVSVLKEGAGAPAPRVPVPVAPYGGVWPDGWTTSPPTPTMLKAFESQVIGASRHAAAPKDAANGPTFFDPVTHEGVKGGYAKTPEGLLAKLNDGSSGPAGTINTLFLAKSPNEQPVAGAARLAFKPAAKSVVVSTALSNALMNDNLFMVVTNYDPADPSTPLGGFDNEIQVGEWTFRLDVGYTADQATTPKTVLVFKFTTAYSVVDLVANAAYWQEWQTFIGPDPARVKIVQSQLNDYLCAANPGGKAYGGALFKDFWAKVTDPSWTGVLAVNCGLDAADLPPDLQDLLGGIDGELRAHHFGVTVNRIAGADSSDWQIDESSVFALVHYQKDYRKPAAASDFGFQVLRLNALFENSALSHFDSRIAVTVPQLFGTNVSLTTPSGDPEVPAGYNAVEIEGVYQKHGDSGTVVFDTKTPQVFSFKTGDKTGFRVMTEVYVTDAALVPVSSVKDEATGAVTVTSNFAMSGVLVFADDVSAKAQGGGEGSGLDLFSYGDAKAAPAAGLGFSAYNFGMTTVIKNNVGRLTGPAPDLTAFRVTPATSAARKGSLVAALPLKLVAFAQAPADSGWPVKFDGQSTSRFAARYALQFQVSLGSLGALSAVADSLDVDLLLGWQPSATDAGGDQVWLQMVPPQTMLGQLGFGIQGVLDTTFKTVELVAATWPAEAPPEPTKAYGVYFNNVQVQLLGMNLIPDKYASKFVLFADPSQGNASNMGWLMTARAEEKKDGG